MVETKIEIKVDVALTIKLNEIEARALKAITVYGVKGFLEIFYKHLGKSALQPYEDGVKSLFDSTKDQFPEHLKNIDNVRNLVNNK